MRSKYNKIRKQSNDDDSPIDDPDLSYSKSRSKKIIPLRDSRASADSLRRDTSLL